MLKLTEDQYFNKFQMPDIESSLLDGKFNEMFENHGYNLDKINTERKFAESKDFINWKQHFIYEIVSDFTSRNVFEDTKQKRLKMLEEHGVISNLEIDGHHLKFDFDGSTMHFATLTSEYPNMGRADMELFSKTARGGHCRTKSIHTVSPNLDRPHFVATGTINGINRRAKYLHTWIEACFDGTPCVIDSTMNAIVDAESYYKLTGAEPKCKIDNKTFAEDSKVVSPLLAQKELYIEQYLTNRDEIMNALQNQMQ